MHRQRQSLRLSTFRASKSKLGAFSSPSWWVSLSTSHLPTNCLKWNSIYTRSRSLRQPRRAPRSGSKNASSKVPIRTWSMKRRTCMPMWRPRLKQVTFTSVCMILPRISVTRSLSKQLTKWDRLLRAFRHVSVWHKTWMSRTWPIMIRRSYR